jgi:limonene-1,2-epoxide hydrolase
MVRHDRSGEQPREVVMAADHATTLRRFMAEWGKDFETVIGAFRQYLAPDAIWEQGPIPTTRSIDEAIGLLRHFRERVGLENFPADVRQLVVQGDVAVAERVDHLRRRDGSVMASIPVTGVFEFNAAGKIAAWREYFDPTRVPMP